MHWRSLVNPAVFVFALRMRRLSQPFSTTFNRMRIEIKLAARRGLAKGHHTWFRFLKTKRAIALIAASLYATVGDLAGPVADDLPPSMGWLAQTAQSKGMEILQATLAIVAIISFAMGARSWLQRQSRYELWKASEVDDDLITRFDRGDDELVVVRGANGAVAINVSIIETIDVSRNPVALMREVYSIPEDLEFYAGVAERKLGPLTLNEGKLGLRTEIDSGFLAGGDKVLLQRSTYLLDRCTNGLIVNDVFDRKRDSVTWKGRPHFVRDDHRLIRLERACASNQLGGSTVLLDQSWNLHLTEQTTNSAESAGLLAPTGSGSFDLVQFPQDDRSSRPVDFQQLCRLEMERELVEETGLLLQPGEYRTFLIGTGRFLYRGGKPEVFGVTAIRRLSVDLHVTEAEELWTAGHRRLSLRGALHERPRRNEMSAPLAANLALLERFLATPASKPLVDFLKN